MKINRISSNGMKKMTVNETEHVNAIIKACIMRINRLNQSFTALFNVSWLPLLRHTVIINVCYMNIPRRIMNIFKL